MEDKLRNDAGEQVHIKSGKEEDAWPIHFLTFLIPTLLIFADVVAVDVTSQRSGLLPSHSFFAASVYSVVPPSLFERRIMPRLAPTGEPRAHVGENCSVVR